MNALIFLVDGTCGPRQKSMKPGPSVYSEKMSPARSVISSHLHRLIRVQLQPLVFFGVLALIRKIARLDLPHPLLDLFEILRRERIARAESRNRNRIRWADRCRAWFPETIRAPPPPADARSNADTLPAPRDFWSSEFRASRRIRSGRFRSHKSPLTRATIASSASRGLIERATSIGRAPVVDILDTAVRKGNLELLIGIFRLPEATNEHECTRIESALDHNWRRIAVTLLDLRLCFARADSRAGVCHRRDSDAGARDRRRDRNIQCRRRDRFPLPCPIPIPIAW